jgi:hypothetical protein
MLIETTLTGLFIEAALYVCEVVIVFFFKNTFCLNELRASKA